MIFGQKEKSGFAWRRGTIGAFVLACAFVLCARAEDRAVKSRVAPVYPEIAKRMKIGGVVRLEVTVDPDGKVADVKQISGNHMLSESAEEAVRKWKFVPGPSQSIVDVDLNFELAQ